MTSGLDQTYAKTTDETENENLRETDYFEEILAEAVYEGLSWVSSILAPALEVYIQGAMTVEIGLRKTRLSTRDCEILEEGLEKAFGFGAKIVEFRILKVLNSKLGVDKEIGQGFKFSDEVKTARRLYRSKR